MLFLGTIQYGVALAGGGALWLLPAWGTDFFWGNCAAQALAGGALLALIAAEAWWAHIPSPRSLWDGYLVDLASSAAIAGFGMAVVAGIGLVLRQ